MLTERGRELNVEAKYWKQHGQEQAGAFIVAMICATLAHLFVTGWTGLILDVLMVGILILIGTEYSKAHVMQKIIWLLVKHYETPRNFNSSEESTESKDGG